MEVSLLWEKWNRLKDEIEKLKPFAQEELVRIQIRKLKNEASVVRFAIEDTELFNRNPVEVLERMKDNREAYKKLWGY